MKISDILTVIDGRIVCGESRLGDEVEIGFASDLMSDVLTLPTSNCILITGLSNIQTVRTAEMADISYILLVRNKKAEPECIRLAGENDQVIIETRFSMFRTCGLLFKAGLHPVF